MKPTSITRVADAVCLLMGITYDELAGASRHALLVRARVLYADACRALTSASWPEIGRGLGRPGHSGIMETWIAHKNDPWLHGMTEAVRMLVEGDKPIQKPPQACRVPRVSGRLAPKFLASLSTGADRSCRPCATS